MRPFMDLHRKRGPLDVPLSLDAIRRRRPVVVFANQHEGGRVQQSANLAAAPRVVGNDRAEPALERVLERLGHHVSPGGDVERHDAFMTLPNSEGALAVDVGPRPQELQRLECIVCR